MTPPPEVPIDPPSGQILLEQLIASDADLEEAFGRMLGSAPEVVEAPCIADPEAQAETHLKGVIPGELLGGEDAGGILAEFLTSVAAEYEDIDNLLSTLREASGEHDALGGGIVEDAIAFVSTTELEDPEALSRALEPLQSESAHLEALFATAQRGLERLDVYNLSRRSSDSLLEVLKREPTLRTVQALVEFLRTLTAAADTFEALALPRPHIRDYLRHLYTMGDWQEMRRLVIRLESAVRMFSDEEPEGGAGGV